MARTAPILLFPSYMSMDRNYRGAIASIEQVDQLVNKATSAADFELGVQKIKQAQAHLDALPVWFLGYYPQRYCTLFCVLGSSPSTSLNQPANGWGEWKLRFIKNKMHRLC
ncbi:MAG: hypothetical protein GDA56_08670 [Hormoscilla sp. GM7CHS1pb]|nr:hypothetical protein [Hormoscilla sp. GM7CHS1pb]